MFKVLSKTANEKLNNLENDGRAQGERDPPGKWTEQRKQITKCPENASRETTNAGCPKGEQSHAKRIEGERTRNMSGAQNERRMAAFDAARGRLNRAEPVGT